MLDATEKDEDFVLSMHLLLQFCLAKIFHSPTFKYYHHYWHYLSNIYH